MAKQNKQMIQPNFKYQKPFVKKTIYGSAKQIVLCSLICTLILAGILGLVIGMHYLVKIPSPLLKKSELVFDEKTDPSVSRLVMMIVYLGLFLGLLFITKFTQKRKLSEVTFFLSFLGGNFLWNCIGECSWHFGFIRIEMAYSLPILIILVVLLLFFARKKVIPFYLLVTILTFMGNWLSHFVMYCPAQLLVNVLSIKLSFLIFGMIFGGLFTIYSLYLVIFASKNKQARMISCMGLYIGIAVMVFSLIEGL